MPPDEMEPGSPPDWIRHARSDLQMARVSPPEDVLPEMLCFHAQQAAEKALKAVLVSRKISVPRTHNLTTLLERLPEDINPPPMVRRSGELSVYAVLTRYPADLEPVSKAEHREAVQLAEAVLKWASRVIERSER